MSFGPSKAPEPCSSYTGNVCTGFGAAAVCMTCGWERHEHRRMEDIHTVHVWKGRTQHRQSPRSLTNVTICGQRWVAINTGPPATEKPLCKECFKEVPA